jgi:hypothetical protein
MVLSSDEEDIGDEFNQDRTRAPGNSNDYFPLPEEEVKR